MHVTELEQELHNLAYTAEVNERYYQIKLSAVWWLDKGVKIGVAVLAVLALLAVFLPHELKWLELVAASLAVVAAVILNVLPVGEWVTEYGEMFRSWSDLFQEAKHLELKAREINPSEPVPSHLIERLEDLIGRQCQLDAMEHHAADEKLLLRCQGDINERMYGKGNRTYAETMEAWRKMEGATANHG